MLKHKRKSIGLSDFYNSAFLLRRNIAEISVSLFFKESFLYFFEMKHQQKRSKCRQSNGFLDALFLFNELVKACIVLE